VKDEMMIRLGAVDLELARVLFDGENGAVEGFAAARERSGEDAQWVREVGFAEHHHNGHLVVRGSFAGHYLDYDEADHVSEKGAGEGALTGGVVGILLGPPGIAVGLVLGGIIGSLAGKPSDPEPEPEPLVGQLRSLVPRSCSAIILIATARDVDEMLSALGDGARDTIRRTLSADDAAALETALSSAPPSAAP
jgi:uncharacterized membrane protein